LICYPLNGELAVPRLAALVLCDGPKHRPYLSLDAPLLTLGQRGGCVDVEDRLDARFRLLCVLSAGPAGT
jgi:hypothetical protein